LKVEFRSESYFSVTFVVF